MFGHPFALNELIVYAWEKAAKTLGVKGSRPPLPRADRQQHLDKQAARHMRLFGQLSDQPAFQTKRARVAQQLQAWAVHAGSDKAWEVMTHACLRVLASRDSIHRQKAKVCFPCVRLLCICSISA